LNEESSKYVYMPAMENSMVSVFCIFWDLLLANLQLL